jgi:hypothetical protein
MGPAMNQSALDSATGSLQPGFTNKGLQINSQTPGNGPQNLNQTAGNQDPVAMTQLMQKGVVQI